APAARPAHGRRVRPRVLVGRRPARRGLPGCGAAALAQAAPAGRRRGAGRASRRDADARL
ncbi:MAG: hypothetical protein AVDCRST_MAG38-1977, partial [uncultured Solirubrobacteraceae bacterium]